MADTNGKLSPNVFDGWCLTGTAGGAFFVAEPASGRVSLESQQTGESLVIRLAGELDLIAAAEFKRVAEELLDRRGVRRLYVDLGRVTFLDSSFLGALLGRYRRINQLGGRMGLIRPPASIRPALELSGAFRIMKEYSSEADALSDG